MSDHARASADDVRRAVQTWSDDQLECRLYGHTWSPHTATRDRYVNLIKVVQKCGNCGTERHQEMNGQTGALYAQWYVYAEGYLSHGMGRITGDGRDTLRLETITRTFKITKRKIEPHSKATREALAHEPAPIVPIKKAS